MRLTRQSPGKHTLASAGRSPRHDFVVPRDDSNVIANGSKYLPFALVSFELIVNILLGVHALCN